MSKGEDGVSGRRADGGGGAGGGRLEDHLHITSLFCSTRSHTHTNLRLPPRPLAPPGAGLFTVRLFNFPEIGL